MEDFQIKTVQHFLKEKETLNKEQREIFNIIREKIIRSSFKVEEMLKNKRIYKNLGLSEKMRILKSVFDLGENIEIQSDTWNLMESAFLFTRLEDEILNKTSF